MPGCVARHACLYLYDVAVQHLPHAAGRHHHHRMCLTVSSGLSFPSAWELCVHVPSSTFLFGDARCQVAGARHAAELLCRMHTQKLTAPSIGALVLRCVVVWLWCCCLLPL